MLLSHNEILELVRSGVIEGAKESAVNAASLDIHLAPKILKEVRARRTNKGASCVDYAARKRPKMVERLMDAKGYIIEPKDFILASTIEVFNLPNNISCEYKLKSSMARIGLEHLNAGWCDAGWNGSSLTLELVNVLSWHAIRIRPGDAIGQMVFFKHEEVPTDASYATRGRYNGDKAVSGIKL